MIGSRGAFSWDLCPAAAAAGVNPPCGCGGCSGCAGRNPPPIPDVGAISRLFEDLGNAVAVGELADRLGLPEGAELVEGVASFVARSPTLQRAYALPETGGIVGTVGSRLVGSAARAWGAVETAAARSWAAMRASPRLAISLAAVGGGVALGSQFLSADERNEAAELVAKYALLTDTVNAVPPEKRAAVLASLGDILGADGRSGGGWGLGTWLGIGGAGALLIWAWARAQRGSR